MQNGTVNILQFVLLTPLSLILTFGIGFILNMLLKTKWLPTFIYIGIVSYYVSKLSKYQLVDIVVLLSGLSGTIVCALTIGTLRKRGYRMF